MVKLDKKTRADQAAAKRHGAIFTSSHALHTKLVGDLSADSFILAFRKLISRIGYPKSITTGNVTNIVAAQREPSEALRKLDNSKIKDVLNQRYIMWKFNPSSASWIGVAEESMAKITKKPLQSVVRDRLFTGEALSVFLTEVESVINIRPLTAVTDDINNLEPFTPKPSSNG